MNRKDRRAGLAQHTNRQDTTRQAASALFNEALGAHERGDLASASRLYKRGLAVDPANAAALNNLGVVLLALGKPRDASERLRDAVALQPQTLDDFPALQATLCSILPALATALTRAEAGWPNGRSASDLFNAGEFETIADDPLLLSVLHSTTVRTFAFECLLTALRRDALAALQTDTGAQNIQRALPFWCALARQCFINDFVFAVSDDEAAAVQRRRDGIVEGIAARTAVAPAAVALLASYEPLGSLPEATRAALADRSWPTPLRQVVMQQIVEPAEERALAAAMPQLTGIDDDVSRQVRAQYEESPYPRWVFSATVPAPVAIDRHLRDQFPTAQFNLLGAREPFDVLVAGCGTGRHAIEVAQSYPDARVLAVDLSLSSLAYAARKTPAHLAEAISYGQADILKLGNIGRTFDLIECRGVLHHLRDPQQGLRALLPLLRPDGVMKIGLYSEAARADIVRAQAFIAEQGFAATADGIRRCRQALLAHPELKALAMWGDFYSTSDCRDLLFHVQESRTTIPQIKMMLAQAGLRFIGFEFAPAVLASLRGLFAQAGWSMNNLDHWSACEDAQPDLFRGMYQFAAQKPSA